METYTDKIAESLNNILVRHFDAEQGYTKAADKSKAASLKKWFEERAVQRGRFAHILKEEIATYGREFDEGGSVQGGLHRAWMDVQAFLSDDNDKVMLHEAVRGEESTIEEYESVLTEVELPPSTEAILKSQYERIKYDLSVIKTLDDIEYHEE